MNKNPNILSFLGIKTELISPTKAIVSLPVTVNILQPYQIVHGGIYALLAETAASLAANATCSNAQHAVGINITSNHLRPTTTGTLIASATPIRCGKTIHVWQVTVENKATAATTLVSTSCVTLKISSN